MTESSDFHSQKYRWYTPEENAFLEALEQNPPDCAKAELLIREGLDVNKMPFSDESLLSDAMQFRSAKDIDAIFSFILSHGLDLQQHQGRHVIVALANFMFGCDDGLEDPALQDVFRRILRYAGDIVKNDEDDTLGNELYYEESGAFQDVSYERSAYCALLGEIVRRFRIGADYEHVWNWSVAKGRIVRDVKLHLLPHKPGVPFFFEGVANGLKLPDCHRGWLSIEFDDAALLISCGHDPMVIPLGDIPGENRTAVSVADRFASILGCRVSAVRIKDPYETEEDAFTRGHLVDVEVAFDDGQLLRLGYWVDRSSEDYEWFSCCRIGLEPQ